MAIGENIKKYRKMENMSQENLSKLSGVPRASISRYEIGDRVPNVDIAKKIASALKIPVEKLVDDSNITDYKSGFFFYHDTGISNHINYYSQLCKNEDFSNLVVKQSLVNLLLHINSDYELVNNLTERDVDTLLTKVSDLLEFELFKISKGQY